MIEVHTKSSYRLNIVTYNIRTLNGIAEDQFFIESDGIDWSIVGLCETKRPGNARITLENGHMLLNSGNKQGRKRNGVGFIIHKKWKDHFLSFEEISERVAVLHMKGNSKSENKVTIIQTYLPTLDHEDLEAEEIHD